MLKVGGMLKEWDVEKKGIVKGVWMKGEMLKGRRIDRQWWALSPFVHHGARPESPFRGGGAGPSSTVILH